MRNPSSYKCPSRFISPFVPAYQHRNQTLSRHPSLGFPRNFEIPKPARLKLINKSMHRRFLALCEADDDDCPLPIRLDKMGKVGADALCSKLGYARWRVIGVGVVLTVRALGRI